MSKIDVDLLTQCVQDLLADSNGQAITRAGEEVQGKRRNFRETVDLQITLKNYDPQRDKRFSGTFRLPTAPKPGLKLCMLGNQVHCEEAEKLGIPSMDVEALKKFNKKCVLPPPHRARLLPSTHNHIPTTTYPRPHTTQGWFRQCATCHA